MTTTMTTAQTILEQLGGNKFIVMTGAKDFKALNEYGGALYFTIGKNASKANRVKVTLMYDDTYTITFYKYTPYSFKIKNDGTFKETFESNKVIAERQGVYFDMLQDIFTEVTGLYTHL